MIQDRLSGLRRETRDAEAVIVSNILNVRYLSGFRGSSAVLLVTGDSVFLLTDSRYALQAAREAPSAVPELSPGHWTARAAELIKSRGIHRVAFEDCALSYRDWQRLSAACGAELVAAGEAIERLRWVKSEPEIEAIREAAGITDLAFSHIAAFIKPGMEERRIALEIDCFMRESGAEKEAFDTIVASGARSALPHACPTDRRVAEGEFIVLDFGARCSGYCADITRTLFAGVPGGRHREVHDTVLEAQARAIRAIRPGITGGEVDCVARECIAAAGFGEYFGHGLGHGLGLDVHDGPILARGSSIVLQPGMVLTVEPGIYIPEWGGVRIEDDVLVTSEGCEVLTRSPKELIFVR